MTRPFFSRERVTDMEIFQRHADEAIFRIKERCQTGEPIEFQVGHPKPGSVVPILITFGLGPRWTFHDGFRYGIPLWCRR